MPARWTLVTDGTAEPDQKRQFREHGVDVVVVPGATAAAAD
ncbi:MAG: hypothetical protein ABIS35_03200 [Terracoccus sp.]